MKNVSVGGRLYEYEVSDLEGYSVPTHYIDFKSSVPYHDLDEILEVAKAQEDKGKEGRFSIFHYPLDTPTFMP